jgi:predicted metalloenzyme YecM
MIPEIREPEDWHKVDQMLKRLMSQTPEFKYDYTRLAKNIEVKIREVGVIDIQLRKQNSHFFRQKRNEKLKEINDAIRMFSKMHLLAALSKR